jgi:lipopolysaccharide biosynthesis protein
MYFMFLPDGSVTPAHRFTLKRLAALDAGLFVICALPDPNMVPRAVLDHADAVTTKGLTGYDFSAYAIGLHTIAENSPGCDLFVMNDSVFGPFADLDQEMKLAPWDFTGYTAYSLIENHVQSYAFVLKGVDQAMELALRSVLRRDFVYDRYKDVVFQQETKLARVASRQMSVGAKWYSHHRSSSEPAFFCALSLLETGFPFMKKSLLRKMPGTYDPDVIAAVLEELGHPRP